MNAVINDWEILVMEEDKTVKTERETAQHYMSLLFHACTFGVAVQSGRRQDHPGDLAVLL